MSLLGVVPNAQAATTTLAWDVSIDGGATWSQSAFIIPSAAVQFRLRISLGYLPTQDEFGDWIPPERGEVGFAGITVLPRLSNLEPGDVAMPLAQEAMPEGSAGNPFSTRIYGPTNLSGPNSFFDPAFIGNAAATNAYRASSALNGAGVPTSPSPGGMLNQLPGGFGRQAPFGANGTAGSGVPTASISASRELQWRSANTNNTGVSFQSATATQSGINAFVVVGQNTQGTTDDLRSVGLRPVGTSFPVGRQDLGIDGFGLQNIELFRYGFTLGPSFQIRILQQTCDILTLAQWYTNSSGTNTVTDMPTISPATISFVGPSPGSLGLFGLCVLVANRRRR
jgi:hypothetical protein